MSSVSPEDLLKIAAKASTLAHCPYSGYAVGAALLTASGVVFSGCNIENASYGLTICAERTAVGAAVADGQRRFRSLAIVASGPQKPYPCGACRQVLSEFCGAAFPVYVADLKGLDAFETLALGELLPKHFEFSRTTGDEEMR